MRATINPEFDPARKESAQGHVGDHAAADGVAEQRLEALQRLLFAQLQAIGLRVGGDLRRIPEARDARLASGSQDQEMAGQQLVQAAMDAVRRGNVAPPHEGAEASAVDLRRPARVRTQRLQLGAEQEQRAELAPEQRLEADPVAGQGHGAGGAVPDGEREHADEPAQGRLDPPGGASLDQDLGIRMPAEGPPRRGQLGPQLGMIVDLAIVGQHQTAAGRDHRLVTRRREIHDRKTPVRQRHPGYRVGPHAGIVGPAMAQRCRHRLGGAG